MLAASRQVHQRGGMGIRITSTLVMIPTGKMRSCQCDRRFIAQTTNTSRKRGGGENRRHTPKGGNRSKKRAEVSRNNTQCLGRFGGERKRGVLERFSLLTSVSPPVDPPSWTSFAAPPSKVPTERKALEYTVGVQFDGAPQISAGKPIRLRPRRPKMTWYICKNCTSTARTAKSNSPVRT